ncbi:outer membrane biogenesis protein BamB [Polystyrenella longa]|uniref:Outer membrane biogenesis protein BamB n=1 Tax=Polystyrenella longa TaxID=2528007 RepID=A0A518CKU4_9PLAN|nr:PQQ-binding-like beta-propeller repeat protein [Polystyrenella longa]QDU79848.1 outer membrane biogenesis protein BamB [Polystyrenella longa]
MAEVEHKVTETKKNSFLFKYRWWILLGIIIIGGGLQTAAWFHYDDERTAQVFSFYPVTGGTGLALVLWWTFVSGFSKRTRLAGLALMALPAIVFLTLYKYERFQGDMLPTWSWRWQPSAAEKRANFISAQNSGDGELEQVTLSVSEGDWPHFRGDDWDGTVLDFGLDPDWDANPPQLLWKHPVGMGWSSFAVVGDYVFTQEQRGTSEKPEESVVCYDLQTGDQRWVYADPVWFSETLGSDGPRATPTFFDSKIYALGATGILNCLDASTGKLIWSRDILEDAEAGNLTWAMSASPLVYDDFVVCNPGGDQNKSVVKYNRNDGSIVWQSGSRAAGYAGAVLATIGDVRQLLVFDGDGLGSFGEATGEQLWFYEWTNQPKVNAALPVVLDDESIFISSGYAVGSARLKPVQDEDGAWAVEEVWVSKNKFRLKFQDAVLIGDYAYGADDGILAALDLSTGKRLWKKGRYGYGQIVRVDDYIIVLTEQGDLALVEATPEEMTELYRMPALQGGITWNHPAVAGDKLLIRNAEEAACYVLPRKEK